MPVRTGYAGAAVAGEVLTAANVNKLPGGWIGYNEVTANQATITTVVDLTSLTVTVTVGASRRIRVSSQCPFFSSVAGDYVSLQIVEGATVLQDLSEAMSSALSGHRLAAIVVLTPTTGSHTYKLRASRASGTGSVTMAAAATSPAFILVEDMGPAA